MKRRILLFVASASLAGITAVSVWAALPNIPLIINGKPNAKPALSQEGETWIPVSALRDAGAEVTVTASRVSLQFTPVVGRNQMDLVEGVAGEWMSNGVWRVRVGAVKEAPNPFVAKRPGYEVEIEFRNLASRAASLHASGLDAIQLIDSDNNQLTVGSSSFSARYQSILPGGAATNRLRFGISSGGSASVGKPDKLLITFRPTGNGKPPRGFRVKFSSDETNP